jgi:hypothetical protein
LILSRYEAVTVLSPAMATGGPEAAHQLSHALRELGVDSGIGYFDFRGGLLRRGGGRLTFQPPETNPCLEHYVRYQPVARESIALRPEHLIILPEVLHDRVDAFGEASIAVWWLSVDNAYQHDGRLGSRRSPAATSHAKTSCTSTRAPMRETTCGRAGCAGAIR